MYVCVCVCVCTHVGQQKVLTLGAGVTGRCKLSNMGAGSELWSSPTAEPSFQYWSFL